MEWKTDKISKAEMERKQTEYMKKAMEMSKKSQYVPEKEIKKEALEIQPVKPQETAIPEEVKMPEEIKKPEAVKPNAGKIIHIEKIIQQVIPVQPEQPIQPVQPVMPVQPEPAQPVQPVMPVQPERFVRPVQPVMPAEPVVPAPEKREEVPVGRETTPRREKTIIEAGFEAQIGFGGILTEQEITHMKPQNEIPEKVRNYSNNDDETVFVPSGEAEYCDVGKNECECDIREIRRQEPPNFTEYLNRHNRQFENADNTNNTYNNCKIHGNRRDNNCPQCNSSKKNWI